MASSAPTQPPGCISSLEMQRTVICLPHSSYRGEASPNAGCAEAVQCMLRRHSHTDTPVVRLQSWSITSPTMRYNLHSVACAGSRTAPT